MKKLIKKYGFLAISIVLIVVNVLIWTNSNAKISNLKSNSGNAEGHIAELQPNKEYTINAINLVSNEIKLADNYLVEFNDISFVLPKTDEKFFIDYANDYVEITLNGKDYYIMVNDAIDKELNVIKNDTSPLKMYFINFNENKSLGVLGTDIEEEVAKGILDSVKLVSEDTNVDLIFNDTFKVNSKELNYISNDTAELLNGVVLSVDKSKYNAKNYNSEITTDDFTFKYHKAVKIDNKIAAVYNIKDTELAVRFITENEENLKVFTACE